MTKGERWVPAPDAGEIIRAVSNEDRQLIIKLLRESKSGYVQQYKLQQEIRKQTRKRYPDTVLLHHLKKLYDAGLVGFIKDREPRARVTVIFLAADYRIKMDSENGSSVHLRCREPPKISLPSERQILLMKTLS
jgi:DNA-binding transcriptional ArsR family regulator